jgi:hypothetical protein
LDEDIKGTEHGICFGCSCCVFAEQTSAFFANSTAVLPHVVFAAAPFSRAFAAAKHCLISGSILTGSVNNQPTQLPSERNKRTM